MLQRSSGFHAVQAVLDLISAEQLVEYRKLAGQAHDDRNLARKLTPMERKEKKMKKLLGDAEAGVATMVSVYRIGSLSSPQLRFKVSVNAEVRTYFAGRTAGRYFVAPVT